MTTTPDERRAGLSEAERAVLELAAKFSGTIHVFSDQTRVVGRLERRGLMRGNGRIIDRKSRLTDAGRLALAQNESTLR